MKEKIEYLLTIKEYINMLYSIKEKPKYDINTNTYELNGKRFKVLRKCDIMENRKGQMINMLLASIEDITIGQIGIGLGVIVGIIGSIEFLAFRMRNYLKKMIKDEIKPIKDELDKNSLNTMKNTICNENIPISERLSVGKEYIEKGGNGAVKIYLHKLETQYEKELKGDSIA